MEDAPTLASKIFDFLRQANTCLDERRQLFLFSSMLLLVVLFAVAMFRPFPVSLSAKSDLRLSALTDQLTAVELRLSSDSRLSALTDKLTAVELRLANFTLDPRLDARLSALIDKLAAVESHLANFRERDFL